MKLKPSKEHRLTPCYRKDPATGERVHSGWNKRVPGRKKKVWICTATVAPTPEAADAHYSQNILTYKASPDPLAIPKDAMTLADLADRFMERKRRAGIQDRSLDEYSLAIQDFIDSCGDDVLVVDLGPAHFAKARAALDARFGTDRLHKFITMVRSMFKWAMKPPLRMLMPDYGDEFDLPKTRHFRLARKADRELNGLKFFEPGDVAKLLEQADRPMRAMILLALNGGFGNTDVAELPRAVVDLKGGWLDYARSKTGVSRRVPLWPETRKALADVIGYKPKSRVRPGVFESPTLVFLTRKGRPYIEDHRSPTGTLLHKDDVSTRFNVLCRRCGLTQKGRGFYSLRRTFRTIADELADERAADLIMGHDAGDMGGVYVQRILDERLRAVAEHVRLRILPSGAGSGGGKAGSVPRRRKTGAASASRPAPGPGRRPKTPRRPAA